MIGAEFAGNASTVRYSATRFTVDISGTFEEVVARYEQLVPQFSLPRLTHDLGQDPTWNAVADWTSGQAPNGFLIYWRNVVHDLMRIAGDTSKCVSYLMGNHVTAERMYRHDPRVMNYAPLRVEITQREAEPVQFTAEIPSQQFGSFGDDRIAAVAMQLDEKLGALLVLLGATVTRDLEHGFGLG